MKYVAIAETDIGISKDTNQDSAIIKHGRYKGKDVLMAIICDGMGGLSKGELASATVIRAFADWFDYELEYELSNLNMEVIGGKWSYLLKDLNAKILEYGNNIGVNLGTTFSGILFIDDKYVIVHVGDTRVYRLGEMLEQLTTDQTFIAREIAKGTMTIEQAKQDKRRNLLLQCVGASQTMEPEVLIGSVSPGVYIICSDGFRHEISGDEIYSVLAPNMLANKEIMRSKAKYLIEQVKIRQEKDNISVIVIKAE